MMTNNSDQTRRVWEIARSSGVAMLTIRDPSGGMSARPMRALVPAEDGSIWFITDRNSPKVGETEGGADALLTCSNASSGDYVVFRGRLVVVDDREKLKSLWEKGDELFFPDGPEDRRAVLLRFDPSDADYWTGGAGRMKFAMQYVKMKITGARPSLGEHGHVSL
jgi:general stress protein 26